MTEQAKDLMMWVGSGPYPTWRAFADEAARMGVCKRVRQVPKGIQVGVSKCYLLHGERITAKVEVREHGFPGTPETGPRSCRYCGIAFGNQGDCVPRLVRRTGKPRRAMYGYFVIDDVLIVTNDNLLVEKYMKAYPSVDICFKTSEQAATVQDRGCGSLKGEAIYLRGPLTEYPEPKPWSEDTFVGFRYYTEGS